MFMISTAHLTLSMILYLMQWPYLCATVFPEKPLARLYRIQIAIIILARAQYLISDAVVVWRAWAVWYDNRWVRGSLLFSLFGTAGTCVASSDLSAFREALISSTSDIRIPRRPQCSFQQNPRRTPVPSSRTEFARHVWTPLHQLQCHHRHRGEGLVRQLPGHGGTQQSHT